MNVSPSSTRVARSAPCGSGSIWASIGLLASTATVVVAVIDLSTNLVSGAGL